ncbi:MAG TPA: cohesin domain-containing protein [Desulfuromonadaceae bacterium]|jgi:hypothetical protein
MIRIIRQLLLAFLLLSVSCSIALGASASVTALGNGIFTVQGNNMDGVAGIDLTLNYDSSSLASPSVNQGSLFTGAMFVANPNFAQGVIKIAVISSKSFSGSGPIATITFATHKGSGTVSIAAFKSINASGNAVGDGSSNNTATDSNTGNTGSTGNTGNMSNITTNNTVNTGDTKTNNASSTTGSYLPPITGSTSTISTSLGTVSMPSDSQTKMEAKPTESLSATSVPPADFSPRDEATAAPAELSIAIKNEEPQKPEEVKIILNTGVLERFHTYQGEKSPAIMMALFKKEVSAKIRQEPAVALSDGNKIVKLIVDLPGSNGISPNFAFNEAKMISLGKDDNSEKWLIDVLPQKGTLKASITVLSGNTIIEYPLTVAAPIKDFSISEAEFKKFLQDNGAKSPRQDINNDGRHDYIDDFIYTANFIVQRNSIKTDSVPKTK